MHERYSLSLISLRVSARVFVQTTYIFSKPSIFSGLRRTTTANDDSSCTNSFFAQQKKSWTTKSCADSRVIPVANYHSVHGVLVFHRTAYWWCEREKSVAQREKWMITLGFFVVVGMLSSNSHAGMLSTWAMNAFQTRPLSFNFFLCEDFW